MSDGLDFAVLPARKALDRTLARGIFIVGIFSFIASLARLAQDAAIAWRYGTGPVVDAYYFVASLANWPVAMALSVLTLLVVPLEAKLQQTGRSEELQHFRGELFAAVTIIAAASLPVAWWALGAIAGGPLGGLEPHTAALARSGVPAIVAVIPFGLVGALLAAWLVAAGRHLMTLFEAVTPLVLLIAVLLLPGSVLFWGTAVGVALQAVVMAVTLRAARGLPQPRFMFASPAWQGVADGALMLVVGQLISAFVPVVDAFFAARLNEGTLATVNFANRMVLGAQGVTAIGLQRVGLPLLSQLGAASPGKAHAAALRWAAVMAGGGILIGLLVAVLADPFVSILFERGRFSAADREQVATLLRWGMLQLPPFLAGVAGVTALASAGAWGALAFAAGLGLAVKIGASAVLSGAQGAVGLQIATALMYTVAMLSAWLALWRRLRRTPA